MRLPLCLALWMALVAAAFGQLRPASVIFTYREDAPARAFRLADEWFVDLEALREFGWSVDHADDQAEIRTGDQNVTIPTRVIGAKHMVPMRAAVAKLGGITEPGAKDSLRILSRIHKLEFSEGKVAAIGTLAYRPEILTLENPKRIVLNLEGARLDSRIKVPEGIRVNQYRPDTVRIVLETDTLPRIDDRRPPPSTRFVMALPKPDATNPTVPTTEPVKVDTTPGQTLDPAGAGVIAPPANPIIVGNVTNPPAIPSSSPVDLELVKTLESETASLIAIRKPVGLRGSAHLRSSEVDVVELALPGVNGRLPDGFDLQSEFVHNQDVRVEGNATILRLFLKRPMGVELWTDANGVQLQLLRPNVGDGKLAGKVIVIDAGHGAHDGGATAGGVREKDLALKISRLLANEFVAQGAKVIMTRKTDVFIPLNERAEIANRNRADFFFSVHINSAPRQMSGTITFFHGPNAVKELLAKCIHREIVEAAKLPNIGVWSDKRIYNSGFAVLRNTKMPGLLLELGFINHPKDRARMQQPDFQTGVAKAIVKGLKVFLGDEKN